MGGGLACAATGMAWAGEAGPLAAGMAAETAAGMEAAAAGAGAAFCGPGRSTKYQTARPIRTSTAAAPKYSNGAECVAARPEAGASSNSNSKGLRGRALTGERASGPVFEGALAEMLGAAPGRAVGGAGAGSGTGIGAATEAEPGIAAGAGAGTVTSSGAGGKVGAGGNGIGAGAGSSGWAGGCKPAPHCTQNRAASLLRPWHCGQIEARSAPHTVQQRAPSRLSLLQTWQLTLM
ncbi:hypothetical protein MASR1M59_04110 [Melaminivora sp.]